MYATPFPKFSYLTLSITFPLLLVRTTVPDLDFNLNDVLNSPSNLDLPLVYTSNTSPEPSVTLGICHLKLTISSLDKL